MNKIRNFFRTRYKVVSESAIECTGASKYMPAYRKWYQRKWHFWWKNKSKKGMKFYRIFFLTRSAAEAWINQFK